MNETNPSSSAAAEAADVALMDKGDWYALARATARALANPDTWNRYALATDAAGLHVEPKSPQAACWCAVGHMFRLSPTTLLVEALREGFSDRFGWYPESANDTGGRECVRRQLLELGRERPAHAS